MDELTRKVLKRACNRFRTGVRKPFEVDGVSMRIEPDGSWRDPDVGDDGESVICEATLVFDDGSINALDGTRRVRRIDLFKVTPEDVWAAYLQSQVDAVHAR